MTSNSEDTAAALLGQAIARLQQGAQEQAQTLLQAVLKQSPRHADALHLLGVIALQRGQHDTAIQFIAKAIQNNPGVSMYHNNHCYALNGAGRLQEALAAAERSLKLSPDLPETHYNRGNVLVGLGRHQEGLAAFDRTIQLRPHHTDAHFSRGVALLAVGRAPEAERSFRRVLELNPDHAGAHNNLAVVLAQARQFEAALTACDRAIQLAPNYAHAHNCRGNVLKGLFRLEEALQACERALALNPDYADAHYNRANMLLEAGCVDEAESSYKRALELNPADANLHSNLLFLQAARADLPFGEMLAALRKWDAVHGRAGRKVGMPGQAKRGGTGRLRVGYVSSDLRSHVVSFFFEPLLAAHDRTAFEIFCYANFPETRADSVTQRLRGHAEHWHFVGDMSDAALVKLIREDGIDILVDLTGHTANNRLKVFTYRPAPVQASYLGFFASTGLAAMDYWITDEVLHPFDTMERSSERIYRLPRCWVSYRPPESAPPVAPCPNSDANVVFGSFSNLAKLTHDVIQTWSRILQAMPGSRLLLMAKALRDPMVRTQLENRFAAIGIAPERLLLRHGAPYSQYFSTYAEVDIVLDPFPRTGGTTTAEALWMGVPVVTLAGQRYVERISASKLTALGLGDLIADDREAYIDKACALARDSNLRGELRMSLRDRMAASPLCDGAGLAHAIEKAYGDMWTGRASN